MGIVTGRIVGPPGRERRSPTVGWAWAVADHATVGASAGAAPRGKIRRAGEISVAGKGIAPDGAARINREASFVGNAQVTRGEATGRRGKADARWRWWRASARVKGAPVARPARRRR